jgi:hypothetical protein
MSCLTGVNSLGRRTGRVALKKPLSKIESKFPLQGTAPKGVVDANHAV